MSGPRRGRHRLDLPREFVRYNRDDPAWLRTLPALIERLAAGWSLAVGPHFPGIRINYVAPAARAAPRPHAAQRAPGPGERAPGTRYPTPCVMKISRHVEETRNEIAALRLWDGDGAARLIEADPEIGALLIERLEPGTMLVEVAEADDDAATAIAAGVLRRLWRPVPDGRDLGGLQPLGSWCGAFDRNRAALSRGAGGFPAGLFRRADALRRDLLASTERPVVLHGDMHHFNVLRAQRAPWLAVDPKGLAGDRCFDVCQFFGNPARVPPGVNRRRLDIFCAELGLDRARTKDWCLVHAVLDACWDYEDGKPWRRAVAYAEETLAF